MARYDKSHKEKSRQALITAAATLFRKRGYSGVGIDELCQAAGLTRGAFYAHFTAKADLLTAVLSGAHDLLRRLKARRGSTPSSLATQRTKVAKDYLHEAHREAVVGGCSIASLAMDTTRADSAAQAAYANSVRQIIDEFMRDQPSSERESAEAALALCVGGLLINSACGADPIGKQISRSARTQVARLLQA